MPRNWRNKKMNKIYDNGEIVLGTIYNVKDYLCKHCDDVSEIKDIIDDLENEEAQTGEILHQIQYSDMDYNGHCNSCKYLEWMVNAVQAFDNQKPFRLDINYVKELYQGDIMYTRFLKTNRAVQYQQVDENGMTCCNAMISQIEKISCC